jgi:hypothetical protein
MWDSTRSSGIAAWQSPKGIEVYRVRALGAEVRVQEILMRELIVRIVMDVLGKIIVNGLKLFGIDRVSAPTWDFAVLDSSEFVVLHPKVSLENFRCGCKPEQGRIPFGQPALTPALFVLALGQDGRGICQQPSAHCSCTCDAQSILHE